MRRDLLLAVAALACISTGATAEIRVEGNMSALRVSVTGDALGDVLSAFGNQLPVRYRTAIPLDGKINGHYSGSLSRVVSRLLDGHNYVIRNDREQTEIIIFGNAGEAPIAARLPRPKSVLSRWQ